MDEALSKGDQARAEILAAARGLFLSQGYNGASMRAIAQDAGGRAVAGLYNHFPTKEAIFRALIEECNPYEELFGVLEDALAGAQTAPEYVTRALRSVMAVMPKHYDFLQLVQIDQREFDGRNLHAVLEDQALPRMMGLVSGVQALPGARPMPGFAWLRLMASLVIGYTVTAQLLPAVGVLDQYTDDEWIDLYVDVLLHGTVQGDASGDD